MAQADILALDLSSSAGWTFGAPGARSAGGVVRLPSIAEPGRMFNAYGDWLADTLTVMQPGLVVMEAAMDLQAMARCHTPTATAYQQIGLAAITDYICDRFEVTCRQVKVLDVRREIMGKSRGWDKDDILAWHRANGFPDIGDHNEADANGVWLYAVKMYRPQRRAA